MYSSFVNFSSFEIFLTTLIQKVLKNGILKRTTLNINIPDIHYNKVKGIGISSKVDLKNHNLNYKIREHSLSKIPILLICGKKEVDTSTVTIRKLGSDKWLSWNREINTY